MKINHFMPTKVHFGRGAIMENSASLRLGHRAFIVAGSASGRRSGALDAVTEALEREGIKYDVFEGIGNNPDVEQCKFVGNEAYALGADFIIGVGGGSPLDAAKAIAVFAKNDISPERLFEYGYDNGILPIAAVPTTSGTGSEVTPYSVLTWHKIQTKRSFGGPLTFPRVAFLDPAFTDNIPLDITRDTAMDAFQHCFESVISIKSNALTDANNFHALKRFASIMPQLESGDISPAARDELMLISMIGGMSISHTGTTMMHALGYPFTYFHNIPHGRANSMVMPVYIKEAATHRAARLRLALDALGINGLKLIDYAERNFPITVECPDDVTLMLWAEQVVKNPTVANTGVPGDAEYIYGLYKELFGG